MLTYEILKEELTYDPWTGMFKRLKHNTSANKDWYRGSLCGAGYFTLRVKGKTYLSHRLAVLYMTGFWPIGVVDHKDGDKQNNIWFNLLDTTQQANSLNQKKAHRDNATGFLGVIKLESNRYKAQIRVGGLNTSLGTYNSAEEASKVYQETKERLLDDCRTQCHQAFTP
jgi:HNH endonuclease